MKYFLVLLILLIGFSADAQRKTKVKLIKADALKSGEYGGKKAKKLVGNVIFKHGNNMMYCDLAYFYDNDNSFDAFGNVIIKDNDSLIIYGDSMHYIGNRNLAKMRGEVLMIDPRMTLTTNFLDYFTKAKKSMYFNGGKIVDKENVLTSELGYYFSRSQTYHFRTNVVLINPQYIMYSDTLTYKSSVKTAIFNGPTKIISDSNSIYCNAGWYNTGNNTASFSKKVLLRNPNQKLWSDSLYYDRKINYGEAFYNITLFDSTKNIITKGQYAEYYEKGGMSFFTDSSMAIIIDEDKDSLFLHADTLLLEIDSNQKAKTFFAFNRTLFFKNKLQGKCDSLVYFLQDSMLIMNTNPLIWGEEAQLSGKRIIVFMANGEVDKIHIDTNSFVLQHDSLEYYNQVSGRNMVVHFKAGDINYVDVFANAQSVYFVREEDSSLVGVNLSSSSDMRIKFNNRKIGDIVYLSKPKSSLNPIKDVSKRALFLRGFKSYEHWRPKTKLDIYNWEPAKK